METDCILSTLKQSKDFLEYGRITIKLQKMKWPWLVFSWIFKMKYWVSVNCKDMSSFESSLHGHDQFWVFRPFIQRSLVKVLKPERILIAVILIFQEAGQASSAFPDSQVTGTNASGIHYHSSVKCTVPHNILGL